MQEKFSLLHLEDRLWIVASKIGKPVYDFDFERTFACSHPTAIPNEGITAIARLGAANDYDARYNFFQSIGIRLIHSPEQYLRASELPNWYPLLSELTPRSEWYITPPSAEQIQQQFGWPVFIKGQRQTSRHQRNLSIVDSPAQYTRVCEHWKNDDLLHWQQMVCRAYVPLQRVCEDPGHGLPRSYEFRCYCWMGKAVAIGKYWFSESYQATASEQLEIAKLAELAAQRLDVPLLVVDIAKTQSGDWIIIECNDGQESGYAGINPMAMWSAILGSTI